MIDIESDTGLLLLADRQARHLANFPDDRLERELQAIHRRAEAALIGQGHSDLEAYVAADQLTQRVRAMVGGYKRRAEASEAARRAEREAKPPP